MQNRLIDFLDDISNPFDQDSAFCRMRRFYSSCGFDFVNIGILRSGTDQVLGFYSNMDPDWLDYYGEQDYAKNDPWLKHAAKSHAALVYTYNNRGKIVQNNDFSNLKMLDELKELNATASICIPFAYEIGNRSGGFHLLCGLGENEFKSHLVEYGDFLRLASAIGGAYLLNAEVPESAQRKWFRKAQEQIQISQREKEVVKHLCAGLQNARIAEKMNITSATVNFHIMSIKKKLGSKTREQIVATCLLENLIET